MAVPKTTNVGDYTVASEIHNGVLGSLWLGVPSDANDPRRWLVRRVSLAEAKTAARVALVSAAAVGEGCAHSHLIPLVETSVSGDEMFFASAFQEGETLRSLLRLAGVKRRAIPTPLALRLLLDIAEAANALHQVSFEGAPVCGGINPDAAMVGTDGRVRLLEPVVAATISRYEPWQKLPRRACYDAPELFADEPTCTPASDVFSLGVLLWEMLRSRPLFAGASYPAVVKRVTSANVRRLDGYKSSTGELLDEDIADTVAKALERPLDLRFDSVDALVEALSRHPVATHSEVALFLKEVAVDALSRQRRRVRRALAGTSSPPMSSRPLRVARQPLTPAQSPIAKGAAKGLATGAARGVQRGGAVRSGAVTGATNRPAARASAPPKRRSLSARPRRSSSPDPSAPGRKSAPPAATQEDAAPVSSPQPSQRPSQIPLPKRKVGSWRRRSSQKSPASSRAKPKAAAAPPTSDTAKKDAAATAATAPQRFVPKPSGRAQHKGTRLGIGTAKKAPIAPPPAAGSDRRAASEGTPPRAQGGRPSQPPPPPRRPTSVPPKRSRLPTLSGGGLGLRPLPRLGGKSFGKATIKKRVPRKNAATAKRPPTETAASSTPPKLPTAVSVGAESAGTELVPPALPRTDSVGADSVGPESVGTEFVGTEAVASDSGEAGTEFVGTEAVVSDSGVSETGAAVRATESAEGAAESAIDALTGHDKAAADDRPSAVEEVGAAAIEAAKADAALGDTPRDDAFDIDFGLDEPLEGTASPPGSDGVDDGVAVDVAALEEELSPAEDIPIDEGSSPRANVAVAAEDLDLGQVVQDNAGVPPPPRVRSPSQLGLERLAGEVSHEAKVVVAAAMKVPAPSTAATEEAAALAMPAAAATNDAEAATAATPDEAPPATADAPKPARAVPPMRAPQLSMLTVDEVAELQKRAERGRPSWLFFMAGLAVGSLLLWFISTLGSSETAPAPAAARATDTASVRPPPNAGSSAHVTPPPVEGTSENTAAVNASAAASAVHPPPPSPHPPARSPSPRPPVVRPPPPRPPVVRPPPPRRPPVVRPPPPPPPPRPTPKPAPTNPFYLPGGI